MVLNKLFNQRGIKSWSVICLIGEGMFVWLITLLKYVHGVVRPDNTYHVMFISVIFYDGKTLPRPGCCGLAWTRKLCLWYDIYIYGFKSCWQSYL